MRSVESGAQAISSLAWMKMLGFFRSLTAPAFGVALRLETEGSPIANHCQRDANIDFHLTRFLCHRTSGGAALRGALPHLFVSPLTRQASAVSSARLRSRQDVIELMPSQSDHESEQG